MRSARRCIWYATARLWSRTPRFLVLMTLPVTMISASTRIARPRKSNSVVLAYDGARAAVRDAERGPQRGVRKLRNEVRGDSFDGSMSRRF